MEKHVKRVSKPFNLYDDRSQLCQRRSDQTSLSRFPQQTSAYSRVRASISSASRLHGVMEVKEAVILHILHIGCRLRDVHLHRILSSNCTISRVVRQVAKPAVILSSMIHDRSLKVESVVLTSVKLALNEPQAHSQPSLSRDRRNCVPTSFALTQEIPQRCACHP